MNRPTRDVVFVAPGVGDGPGEVDEDDFGLSGKRQEQQRQNEKRFHESLPVLVESAARNDASCTPWRRGGGVFGPIGERIDQYSKRVSPGGKSGSIMGIPMLRTVPSTGPPPLGRARKFASTIEPRRLCGEKPRKAP